MFWANWSLRTKLIAACVLVQMAAAAVLVYGSSRLLQRTLHEQARLETQQVVALLGQAIAAPLAQRDYATLQQTLDLVRVGTTIHYLVLRNHRGQVVASTGWDQTRTLPTRDEGDIDLDRDDPTWHIEAPVSVAGQALGHLDLGLSTTGMRQARADFLRSSVVVGTIALTFSIAILAAISFAITRHLARLAHASQRVAEGDFDVHVPATANDEIGRLGASFNAMAMALKDRLAALEASEAQQKIHLQAARDEQLRLATLLDAMQSGMLLADQNGTVVYANAAFNRLWSVPEATGGRTLAEIVSRLLRQVDDENAVHIQSMLDASARTTEVRELRTLEGKVILQRMQPVTQGAHSGGSIWFYRDVTLERHTQQRARQALQDPLTSLVNRLGLNEALQAAVDEANRSSEPLSLLFIDLDDFKHANDVAGHRMGDEILVTVARTLSGQMRKGEIVSRLGGDEFAVLCPRTVLGDATAIAARLVEAVSGLRFQWSGQTLRVGCSIGVATFPADASTGDDLVACADAAMYEAKRGGKNSWAAFRDDPYRLQAESARVSWNTLIQAALQDQRFVLRFQPVRQVSDLRVAHHEALVRMVDENEPGRLISPAEFLPHAERSGKIRQIDRWVFEACVTALASAPAGVRIAANLSARSLEDPGFPGFLHGLFQRYDVDPRRLHIELTEAAALSDAMQARALIDTFHNLGCAVHLDDFGSGFSSFAQLKLLPADAIKIDGTIIRNLQADSSNRLLVASMIEIAHDLKKLVVAEHVEDAATLDALRSLGVDMVQGFHLGRPSAKLAEDSSLGQLRVVVAEHDKTRGSLV